ncbi:hybrid sensor histidine kinase/response regulator [Pseudorhodoferax sp. LjRoot39]|uniref:ATP-binding response regulator n=1 Tax=Pseudorhodoferax sp. LjRoot39 TaxID=3342328 RepID=UPI003ECD7541
MSSTGPARPRWRSLSLQWVPTEVEAEQLERMVRTTPWSWLLSTVAALICYLQYADHPAGDSLRWWFAAYVAVVAARLALWAAWLRLRTQIALWVLPALGTTLAMAALWGALCTLLPVDSSPQAESILHIALACVALGGTARMACFDRALVGYVVLILGPMIVRDLLIGGAYHWLMALLLFLIGVYGLLNGTSISRALREVQNQRRRNAELVEQLRQEAERSSSAHQQALQAGAAKTRFFAAANHDLRQPLHAMGLLVHTLRTPNTGAAPLPDMAGRLADCVDGMTLVIDGLLDMSRMDAGEMAPQWSVFALDELVRECCAPLRIVAQAQGLAFTTDIVPATVRSDRVLLARVLANLVSNAIRYTHEGAVHVVARADGGQVRLTVEDTGIGIAPEHLPRIFDAFYQVGNAGRDRRLGLGLGLSTVQRIGALLSLQLTVRSQPDQGSAFTLVLPRVASVAEGSGELADAGPSSPLRGRRVLVVDDDADSRDAMVHLLASWACAAHGAASAAAGLARLADGFAPDALVVDLRLAEGASGIDAVQTLQAAAGRPLPALIVTGDAGSEHLQRARTAGLQVCVKPVRPVQLRAFLAQAFAD